MEAARTGRRGVWVRPGAFVDQAFTPASSDRSGCLACDRNCHRNRTDVGPRRCPGADAVRRRSQRHRPRAVLPGVRERAARRLPDPGLRTVAGDDPGEAGRSAGTRSRSRPTSWRSTATGCWLRRPPRGFNWLVYLLPPLAILVAGVLSVADDAPLAAPGHADLGFAGQTVRPLRPTNGGGAAPTRLAGPNSADHRSPGSDRPMPTHRSPAARRSRPRPGLRRG